MTDPTGGTPLISASMRAAYKSCPRKVFYRYVAGIQPKTGGSKAQAIGRAYHKALYLIRQGHKVPVAINEANKELIQDLQEFDLGLDAIEDEQSRLNAYILGYGIFYKDDPKQTAACEYEIRTDTEVAYIDCIQEIDGCKWVIEDKTTSRLDPNLEMALRLDEQLLNYNVLLNSEGILPKGIKYRQTLKTSTKRTKKETGTDYAHRVLDLYCGERNADFYREIPVAFGPAQLTAYSLQKDRLDRRIRQMFKTHTLTGWDCNPGECMGKWGPCEWLPLCANGTDQLGGQYIPNGKEPLDSGSFINKYLNPIHRGDKDE